MGRPAEMTIEFTQFERPRRLASVTTMDSMDIEGALTFDPIPPGTRMRWSWELRPRGATRFLAPMIARAGKHQEQEIWSGLKRYVETPATGTFVDKGWTPRDTDEC